MEKLWNSISEVSKSYPISRVRFMMLDLLAFKSNGYVARREELKAVKLSEIRSDSSVSNTSTPPMPAAAAKGTDEWTQVLDRKSKPTNSGKQPQATTITRSYSSSSSSSMSSSQNKSFAAKPVNAERVKNTSAWGKPNDNAREGQRFTRSVSGGSIAPPPPTITSNAPIKAVEESRPAHRAAVETQPPSYSPSEEDMATIRGVINEFFDNQLEEEVYFTLNEKNIVSNEAALADVFKHLLNKMFEFSREEKRKSAYKLIENLCKGRAANGQETVYRAAFLAAITATFENLEDIRLDIPFAVSMR